MAITDGEKKFWENYAAWKKNPRAFYLSKDLLLVDWKSKKYRGKDRWNDKLSPSQWQALKTALIDNKKIQKKTTLLALRKRGLLEESGELTTYGRLLAIKELPLEQQCIELNIPLEEWHMPWRGEPEKYVRSVLSDRGAEAFCLENTFGHFIDYMMGKATLSTAEKLDKKVFTLNLLYDLEVFFWVKRELDNHLSIIDIDHCLSIFPQCSPFLTPLLEEYSENYVLLLFDSIFRSLGVEKVKKIILKYFDNPLAYNFRGWPDLFVIENQLSCFVEVKTTDRLHINQLVTIPDLIQANGIPIKIVRLHNSRKYYPSPTQADY